MFFKFKKNQSKAAVNALSLLPSQNYPADLGFGVPSTGFPHNESPMSLLVVFAGIVGGAFVVWSTISTSTNLGEFVFYM